MYKFYCCEFTNKVHQMPESDKVFIKFGVTHHTDVMDRFNPTIQDGYAKNYNDWNIVCKFSMQLPDKEAALALEKFWLEEQFPYKSRYKVWVEQYLGLEDNQYYTDNTGITELRLVSAKQAKWVYYKLHQYKSEYNNA